MDDINGAIQFSVSVLVGRRQAKGCLQQTPDRD